MGIKDHGRGHMDVTVPGPHNPCEDANQYDNRRQSQKGSSTKAIPNIWVFGWQAE